MELSKSFTRRDRSIQLIRQDSKSLTLFNRIKCKTDDTNDLEEVIDVDRDLEIYQKNTLRSLKTTIAISYGNI
jgi:hypothetical protein